MRACMSEVQRVRLSRSSCMMSVLSLYDSSPSVSSSAMASSKACARTIWSARSPALLEAGHMLSPSVAGLLQPWLALDCS